jgi:hypothetical protein
VEQAPYRIVVVGLLTASIAAAGMLTDTPALQPVRPTTVEERLIRIQEAIGRPGNITASGLYDELNELKAAVGGSGSILFTRLNDLERSLDLRIGAVNFRVEQLEDELDSLAGEVLDLRFAIDRLIFTLTFFP